MRFLVHVHGLIQALLLFVVRLLFMDVPGLVSNRLFLCGQGMFWVCVQFETYEISWSHRQRRRARWLLKPPCSQEHLQRLLCSTGNAGHDSLGHGYTTQVIQHTLMLNMHLDFMSTYLGHVRASSLLVSLTTGTCVL